jgi:hypothetical protein
MPDEHRRMTQLETDAHDHHRAHAEYDAETPDGRNLEEIREQQGMKAFLEARDAPFRD